MTGSAQTRPGRAGGPVSAAAAVTAAGFGASLLSYAVLLVAVHLLDSSNYGQIVVLLNVLLVGSVPSFAVQTVTARRVATETAAGTARACAIVSLAAACLLAALAMPLAGFLHLDGPGGLLLVAASLPGVTVLGMCQGVLQGQRRFTELGLVLCVAALGRSGAGLAGLVIGRDPTGALLGILVGVSACAAVLAVRLRTALQPGPPGEPLREIGHALHAHGTFWLLSTLDLLLARHVLPSHDAAVYATGSVITRAAIWLPQSVATLAFPRLTDVQRHRSLLRLAVLIVGGVGAIVVLGAAALPSLAARVVGGGRYPELVPYCWQFAALGACLAVLQLGMVAGLALRRRRQTAVLWSAVLADTVLVLSMGSHATLGRVITTVLIVTAVAAVASVLLDAVGGRVPQLAEELGQAAGT